MPTTHCARGNGNRVGRLVKQERGLLLGLVTLGCFTSFGNAWLDGLSGWALPLCLWAWLLGCMLWLSFSVVRHADCLAKRLGEPYGTLILTLSVISIEIVMISAMMLTGANNPILGRDMMFAVLMIVLNGLVGISLLGGGLRHIEQTHNLQGANSFLAVLIPLALLFLILPNYTESTERGTLSLLQALFAIVASIGLYGAFLFAQTLRHKGYFSAPARAKKNALSQRKQQREEGSIGFHALLLLANLLPIVLLSKQMAKVIDYSIVSLNAPVALGGLVIAILVLAPEGLAAVKAAFNDQLQRSVNICLGSALATIGMTVPAVLVIGLLTGSKVVLGLDPVEAMLLGITILVSVITFASRKTNLIHGVVHLIIFGAYIVMVFD